jgi:hypothetical protein
MKNLILLSALAFGLSQTFGLPAHASAERLLHAIPACKEFQSVKKVNEADKAADEAMDKASLALGNIKSFDGTCSSMAGDSSYNSSAKINELNSNSLTATKSAASAVTTLDAAIKTVTPVANSLGAIGAPKSCVNEAKALPGKLAMKKREVEAAMKKVESCVNRASTGAESSISTKAATNNGFKPNCMYVENAQPGINCIEEETQDGEVLR